MDYKVLVGLATGEYARRADFYDYFNLLEKPAGSFALFAHDRSPAKSRNMLIDAAKDVNCSHILIIDDDVAPEGDHLMRLLAHDVDIVSGLYFMRSYPHAPVAFDIANEKGECMPMYMTPNLKGLHPVVAAGFGFLLIKMSVFDKLEKPYVRLAELDPEEWCDDIGFFKRVREAGIQSYVDLDVHVGHQGTMIVKPRRDKDGNWFTNYNTGSKYSFDVPQINSSYKYDIGDAGNH